MVTKFPITPESISHTDVKLAIRNNYTKYLNHRRRYEIICSYDLFWEKQDYFNKLIQDVVAEFGMRYLVVPTYNEDCEPLIVIIFDTSSSLFDDSYNNMFNNEQDFLHKHCENQRKEINLLLKQKDKLEKKLEECKNRQVDMLAYRDDIIGLISRKKNELENANKAQLRYINEMEANIKKGNEEYKKLKEEKDREIRLLKGRPYKFEYDSLKKANKFYRDKIHEMFDILLNVEFEKKNKEEIEKLRNIVKEVDNND